MKRLLSSVKKISPIPLVLSLILSLVMILLSGYLVYHGYQTENIISGFLFGGINLLLLILFWIRTIIN